MSVFKNNSRIEQHNGMKFYEQDVAMLNYTFFQDSVIEFEALYNNPGIGIVLTKINSYGEKESSYLIKTSVYDFYIYRVLAGLQENLFTKSAPLSPNNSIIKFKFYKNGANIKLTYIDETNTETIVGSYVLPELFNKYQIGIYSNANNTVCNLKLYEGCPQNWTTNIQNTNSGRISFQNNTIVIEDADNDIEAECQHIRVPEGLHFFSYNVKPINDEFDCNIFLYPSIMETFNIDANKKNILKENQSLYGSTKYFELTEPTDLTILIQGKSAEISNIAIKDKLQQEYVSTNSEQKTRSGSKITFDVSSLKKIEIDFEIDDIPAYRLDEQNQYSVYTYAGITHTLESLFLTKNKRYNCVIKFDHNERKCYQNIYNDNILIFIAETLMDNSLLEVFDNVKGTIYSIVLTDTEDKEWYVMLQKTIKQYIPNGFNGPILVLTPSGEPLDISSAYRHTSNNKYIFTNWAREYFESNKHITLDYDINDKTNIIVYAFNDSCDKNKIYEIEKSAAINTIDLAVKNYTKISDEFYSLDDNRTLIFDKAIYKNYDFFIIDYLKNNSYAINFNQETNLYEVDISTSEEYVHTYYDRDTNNNNNYIPLDITPQDEQYIVISRSANE